MSWSLQITTARETGPAEVTHDPDIALQRVGLALFGAREPFTITVNPNADGGWGEAPAPTITWDPR